MDRMAMNDLIKWKNKENRKASHIVMGSFLIFECY